MTSDLKKLEELAEREFVQWLSGYVDALRDLEEFSPMQFHALDERMAHFIGSIDQLRKVRREREQTMEPIHSMQLDDEDLLPF